MTDEEREKALKKRMDDLWAQIKEHVGLLADVAPDVESGDVPREEVVDFWIDLFQKWGEINQDESWLTATSRFVVLPAFAPTRVEIRVRREAVISWWANAEGYCRVSGVGHSVRDVDLTLAEMDELMGFKKSPKVVNTPEPPASEGPDMHETFKIGDRVRVTATDEEIQEYFGWEDDAAVYSHGDVFVIAELEGGHIGRVVDSPCYLLPEMVELVEGPDYSLEGKDFW